MGVEDRTQHTVYVEPSVWAEATRRAKAQYGKREGVSAFLRDALAYYTEQPGAKMPRRPRFDESEHATAS
ncbi:MAG TPA: hypothetical protein VGH43_02710 [Jatrophihabitans sp.]|jgi:hypothetical protein